MKALSLILVFVSLNAFALDRYGYSCECIDTGLECDGGDRLDVSVKGNAATLKYGAADDFSEYITFKTILNQNYKPKSAANMKFKKFDITSATTDGYVLEQSSFLIDQNLLSGNQNGDVKFQSVEGTKEKGYFTSWSFQCERVK